MKFVVDEMPSSPGKCPFCNGVIKPTCNLLHNDRCEYFNPRWGYDPNCPLLVSLEEIQNKS